MANYSTLISQITTAISANGQNLITGVSLQAVLLQMVSELGQAGYIFGGVVNPEDSPASSDSNLFYVAATAGTYTNFNGATVNGGELAIFTYMGGSWGKNSVTSAATPVVNDLTTGGVTSALSAEMGKQIGDNISQLQQEVDGLTLTWQEGYINSSGVLVAPDGYSQLTSQRLTAAQANGIKITFGGNYCIRLAYFNGDTLVSRSSFIESSSSPYTIETEYSVYISLMTKYYSSYTKEQMLQQYSFVVPGGLMEKVSSLETTMESTTEDVERLDDDMYTNIVLTWESGYINSSGNLTPQDGYSQYTSQKLSAKEANKISVTFGEGFQIRLSYFDGDTFVSRSALINSSSSPYSIETEYSVRISIMTQLHSSYSLEQMLPNYSFSSPLGLIYRVPALESKINAISPFVDKLNESVYGVSLEWNAGNINNSGVVIESTQSNYYSQILPNSEVDGISIEVESGYLCNLAFYNNGVFVSRYGWIYNSTGKVTISTQYGARIMIGRDTFDNTKTAEEIIEHIHISGIDVGLEKRVESLESKSGSSDFLSRMAACDFDGKILHFSFDDTCWCLYDLIQNANTYESIFDEPFFEMLKEVHDSTGMVFTLNTFNSIAENTSGYYPTGFSISNVPNKFQSNFQANKGWLNFAFHAKDENTNYNTASGAGTDYATFVSAIYTLTGDYDCIDRVTRLGYFGGSLANCLALRDAAHGPVGFFGADDTRAYDYYLTADQYGLLRKKGKFFDETNKLFFIKTQYRTFATGKQDVENNLCFQKVTEFFAHEYEGHLGATWDLTTMKNNIISLATWATGLGYKFEYPEKIYG